LDDFRVGIFPRLFYILWLWLTKKEIHGPQRQKGPVPLCCRFPQDAGANVSIAAHAASCLTTAIFSGTLPTEIHTAPSMQLDHSIAENIPEQNPNSLQAIAADIDSNNQSNANGPKHGGDMFGATL
jgi:hypothetical protein